MIAENIYSEVRKFRLINRIVPLGEGGMATVYQAKDERFDTDVAIKCLKKEYQNHPDVRSRFLREARLMNRMSHTNIVRVIDLIESDELVAMVMEYIEGESLKSYIERKRLSDAEIHNIILQVLEATKYVHSCKLIHRDIKPHNFMITSNGLIKMLDFGIAKEITHQARNQSETRIGTIIGSPRYMSPEQTMGDELNEKSDIYSLGVLLWELKVGTSPYQGLNDLQLRNEICNETLPETHSKWDRVLEKALDKDPDSRFRDCAEFIEYITRIWSETSNSSDGPTIVSVESFKECKIGGAIWMQENLNVKKFRNGDDIFQATTQAEWVEAGKRKQPAWYDISLGSPAMGVLYNFYAVADARGLAPHGWRIADFNDWKSLKTLTNSNSKSLKHKEHWKISSTGFFSNPCNGDNSSGFSALPAGGNDYEGICEDPGANGYWWISEGTNHEQGVKENRDDLKNLRLRMGYDSFQIDIDSKNKANGYSVRCVKI